MVDIELYRKIRAKIVDECLPTLKEDSVAAFLVRLSALCYKNNFDMTGRVVATEPTLLEIIDSTLQLPVEPVSHDQRLITADEFNSTLDNGGEKLLYFGAGWYRYWVDDNETPFAQSNTWPIVGLVPIRNQRVVAAVRPVYNVDSYERGDAFKDENGRIYIMVDDNLAMSLFGVYTVSALKVAKQKAEEL